MGRFGQKSIIHVLPRLTKGGAETLVANLLNDAVNEFDQVTLILATPNNNSKNLYTINSNIKIKYVVKSYKLLWIVYLSLFVWIVKERKLIYSADIIHGHLTFGSVVLVAIKILSLIFSEKNHRPVYIETYHAVGMSIARVMQWFHSLLLVQKDAVILVGDDPFWRNFIKRKVHLITRVIRNGIPLPVIFDPFLIDNKVEYKKRLNIPEECQIIIGTISRLSPDRQPEKFLSVFKELSNRLGNKAHYILSGDGVLRVKLEELARTLGISEKVHFTGLVEDPYRTIQFMDVYVTLIGGDVGLAGMEACAVSKPVVGIQIARHYKTNISSWVWSSVNEGEVANKICQIITSKGLYVETVNAQYNQLILNHSFSSLLQDYYQLYDEVMKNINLTIKKL